MEQVKQWEPSRNAVMFEDDGGKYVLASDHARCVQDCRRMAELVQALDERMVIDLWADELTLEQLQEKISQSAYRLDSQAVLDRWPEVTNG